MYFVLFSDLSDSIEMVVFPKVLEEFKNLLIPEECLVVKAKVSVRNGEKSLIAEKVKKM
jgi:DNA polymerase III alpha subunit